MKKLILATAAAMALAKGAVADAVKYTVDASHAQVVFAYKHLGFSTTFGMFSGWTGEIMFDADNPAASSVTVSIPTSNMMTGWDARDGHLKSPDFLDAKDGDLVTFVSTGIEVTGDNTALITGDLTVKGVTKSVVLDTMMNQNGAHPFNGKPALGFDATTTILRSDFGAGKYAPNVGDELKLTISIEAVAG